MSSTLLERARAFHEDVETYEVAIIKELSEKPKSNKDKVLQQHRISNLLDQAVQRSTELESFYADADDAVKQEVASMRGKDALRTFYERAKDTWSYHTRYPGLPVKHGPDIAEESKPKVVFSGEELFGKFFDLHSLYVRWVNMPQCTDKQLDYGKYLSGLVQLSELPERSKRSKAYMTYLEDLEAYLLSFLQRTQPLVDLKEVASESAEEFSKAWEANKVKGWARSSSSSLNSNSNSNAANGGKAPASSRTLDLSMYYSHEDLMPLGMERLKEALEALGMKCGGTLEQRAQRLMSVKGVKPADIDPKLLAKTAGQKRKGGPGTDPTVTKKAANGSAGNGSTDNNNDSHVDAEQQDTSKSITADWRYKTALLEYSIRSLLEALSDVLEGTIRQVDKKQTRTAEERDAEIQQEEAGVLPDLDNEEEEDSDDDGPIYNPLNLPLGWDGKPIPFWLYKLHGLGVEYKCEICGDNSYWGRKNFDKHFQEFRHAHGMRCLGIPNTKHFHDITRIQDAIDLYAKLKDKLDTAKWTPDAGEEYEDSEGNVLNRRTYEDLARQGLL